MSRNIKDMSVFEEIRNNPNFDRSILEYPIWDGECDQSYDKFQFTKPQTTKAVPLIDVIINVVDYIQLSGDEAYVSFPDGDKVYTDVNVVKFIKACVTAQVSNCEQFSAIAASYTSEFLARLRGQQMTLPIEISYETDFQKEILAELNDYVVAMYEENGIPYSGVVKTVKAKQAKTKKKTKKPKPGQSSLDYLSEKANENS